MVWTQRLQLSIAYGRDIPVGQDELIFGIYSIQMHIPQLPPRLGPAHSQVDFRSVFTLRWKLQEPSELSSKAGLASLCSALLFSTKHFPMTCGACDLCFSDEGQRSKRSERRHSDPKSLEIRAWCLLSTCSLRGCELLRQHTRPSALCNRRTTHNTHTHIYMSHLHRTHFL